ncbi:MAG: hypothetical protein LBI01_04030 [Elusimicrobium sp.]|jgi:nitrogen fixation/metabolism regulation signal transduction histidine kinase|nr:hypothetical protein [Elusimicrobium sp.]
MTENQNNSAQAKPLAQAAPPQQFQRRIIFIKKDLQYGYMFLIVVSVLLGIAITVFEVLSTFQSVYKDYPAILQPLYGRLTSIFLTFGLKIAVYLALVILFSAILSNKLAGPIFRFEKTCDEIAEGDVTKRVRLRKGDQFITLQNKFNNMMDVLDKRIKRGK